jgi:hypothetical protein
MLVPVNLFQSPISTANPSPVTVSDHRGRPHAGAQIPRILLGDARNRHADDLIHTQQPGTSRRCRTIRCARRPALSSPIRGWAVGQTARLNGGYLSVTSRNAYAITRCPQRSTPSTNRNIPLG